MSESKESLKFILLKLLLLLGIIVFFYPNISDYINTIGQTRAVVDYSQALKEDDTIRLEEILKNAQEYNARIRETKEPLYNPSKIEGYTENLNPMGNGMMGYVTIEKINLSLPIYHGMGEGIIQESVGHLEGTSLPVGGPGTHSVISTHSGLPSAKLFTDLTKLELGDTFRISVLNEDLTYKIDQIIEVLPHEIDELRIVEGKDYVTMFTCTPYGINTHRLFVRGERIIEDLIEKEEENNIQVEDNKIKNILKSATILILILVVLGSIVKDVIIYLKNRKV